jgi:aspartyl-tRNA(Asn)/glutamyl-tRNA(Gln) amidotransferase subunit C
MKINDELVVYVSELSRLEQSPEDVLARKKDLTEILDYVEKLNEVDTDGVVEMTHPYANENVFRDDVVTNSDLHEGMLANAPARSGDYFKVHKTVDE